MRCVKERKITNIDENTWSRIRSIKEHHTEEYKQKRENTTYLNKIFDKSIKRQKKESDATAVK